MSELPPNALPAGAARAMLSDGRLTPRALVAACRARIGEREPEIRAWAALDDAAIEAELARVEAIPEAERGPLWGLPVAVKDVFDTADLPTTYGSEIYAGHRPIADAAAVARLREAGAVVLGKTVSTEFAYWRPGPTRNPRDLARTPGGSSQGSAAAVADRMVPLALGTQTAASVIRPAAFCGVVGFKPTRGLISTAGVKALAGSFDTVGVMARTVADAARLAGALAAADWAGPPAPAPIARWQGAEWAAAEPSAIAAVEAALARLVEAGAEVASRPPPAPFDGLTAAQTRMMAAEAARDLAHEARTGWERLSPELREVIAAGRAQPEAARATDRALVAACAADPEPLFGPAAVLASPAAMGEAPPAEAGTGSPDMSRGFTALGLPSITIPVGRGPSGLPLGLQLVARPREDARLLALAAWAEATLGAGA